MCYRPPKVSDDTNKKICPECGAENDAAAETCTECGTDLKDVAAEDVSGGSEGDAPAIAAPKAPVVPAAQNLPNLGIEYPEAAGSTAIRTNIMSDVVNDGALWRFLKKGVVANKENVACWYESPATALIQDPETGMVVGVEIEHDGKKVNIAARNGVILASGGFENSPEYTQQFTGNSTVLPVGTLYNEGDGVRMAQAAGAKLWHMNAWESSGIGLAPAEDRMRNMGEIPFFKTGSCILVGGDGRRYIAEDAEQKNGRVMMGGSWVIPARPDRNFFIFDEAQRLDMAEGRLNKPYPNWSSDLSAELESGKVVKADSLQDLASKLDIDTNALQSSVDLFNRSTSLGIDAFGRKPENSRAFGGGPYYGVAMFPSMLNTQGGPERTAKAEVLDVNGNPIPHLYSAGELGSITARRYQGGGNLSECIVFGNIAGREAAAAKDDSFEIDSANLSYDMSSGQPSVYEESTVSTRSATEGTATGEGLSGPIRVKVTSVDGAITNVEVVSNSETEEIGQAAIEEMPLRIVKAGNTDVDVVAGATVTSLGIIAAVNDAIGS